ncbi:MAG: hypothetical protein KF916_06740 [Microbacteriaceae bacterium]|nr:hypothetical protein [Microbacteriaceae bacterium]
MAISKGFGAIATAALLATTLVSCSAGTVACPDTLQPALALLSTTQEAETVASFTEVSPIPVAEPSCAFKVNHGGQVIGFWMEKDQAFVDQITASLKQAGYVAFNDSGAYFTDGTYIIGIGNVDENGETALTGLSGLVTSAAIIMVSP